MYTNFLSIQNNISFVLMYPYSYIVDSERRWHIQNCGENSVKAMCIGLPLHTDVTGSNWKTSNQKQVVQTTPISEKFLKIFSFKGSAFISSLNVPFPFICWCFYYCLQSFKFIRTSCFFLLYEEVLKILQIAIDIEWKK